MAEFTITDSRRLLELQAKPAKKMSAAERREYNVAPEGAVALAREVVALRRTLDALVRLRAAAQSAAFELATSSDLVLSARYEDRAEALRMRAADRFSYDEAVDALVWSTEGAPRE